MSEEKAHKCKPFDDSGLPVNSLTVERIEEIEKLVVPRLDEAFDKLRKKKPHLFKSPKNSL